MINYDYEDPDAWHVDIEASKFGYHVSLQCGFLMYPGAGYRPLTLSAARARRIGERLLMRKRRELERVRRRRAKLAEEVR